MNADKLKRQIILHLPYIPIALLGSKIGMAWRLAEGADISTKTLQFITGFGDAFQNLAPSFVLHDLIVGIVFAAIIRLAIYAKSKNAKKFRKDTEYGSARWSTHEDIAPYMDKDFRNNIILTKTEGLTMNSRPKDPKTARNKNVLVIGGSGSGKTRYVLKPNLMQCDSETYPCSFVVTDPKGEILNS